MAQKLLYVFITNWVVPKPPLLGSIISSNDTDNYKIL